MSEKNSTRLSERLLEAQMLPEWLQEPLDLCNNIDELLQMSGVDIPQNTHDIFSIQAMSTRLRQHIQVYAGDASIRNGDTAKTFGPRIVLQQQHTELVNAAFRVLIVKKPLEKKA
ncbi:MAG: hypothetical protein RI911_61 [Candidatus Parcubacteria bacterium]|jgi:hypothetical protein